MFLSRFLREWFKTNVHLRARFDIFRSTPEYVRVRIFTVLSVQVPIGLIITQNVLFRIDLIITPTKLSSRLPS